MARELPTGIQDFAKLRESGMVYIDKTAYLFRLAHTGKPYILARPRRFGKSLLVSTLKEFWEGRRELFEGLAIYDLESARPDAWTPRPVFHLDLDGVDYTVPGALEAKLDEKLCDWEEVWGKTASVENSLADRFLDLIIRARNQTGHRVVALVDDHDKPQLDAMGDDALVERNRGVLKGLYGVLKKADGDLESVFVTGVTRFSMASIFSGVNNLNDISLSGEFAGICGVTESEIARFLAPEVARLAELRNVDFEGALKELRECYGGYCFHPGGPGERGAERVYNPYSLLCALDSGRIGSYWFGTGTPTFPVRGIRDARLDVRSMDEDAVYASSSHLLSYRAESPDPVPLLFQAGYLTIKGYDDNYGEYALGIPNREAREGLFEGLLSEYTGGASTSSGTRISDLRRRLDAGDADGVRDILGSLFAHIPYTTAGTGGTRSRTASRRSST